MFISPAYIQKSIIERLKIKSCSKCDLLRNACETWNARKKNKPRKKCTGRYTCDLNKCCGLVSIEYLRINGCIINDYEVTEILDERACKNKPISLYEPSETPRQRTMYYEKREEENDALVTDLSDVVHINSNNEIEEKNETDNEQKLIDDIEAVFRKHMYRMHTKTKAKMLYNVICQEQKGVFQGKVHDIFVENVLNGDFGSIFKPWRILQAIDSTNGGTVNYSGIDCLRDALRDDNPLEDGNYSFDSNGKRKKKRRTLFLPSSFKIKQCAYQLEDYAKKNHLECEITFEGHEIIRFNYTHILKFLLKMYKLDILAKSTENVEIAITLDGSKLTNQLFHVTAGLKIIDIHARHPKLDTLLLPTDVETSGMSSIQSRDNSYVVEMHLMKDTKEGYKAFTKFFEFYNHVGKYGLPRCDKGLAIKKLSIVSPQDLKSHWSCLLKGGAAKNVTYPCHCCNITSADLTKFKSGQARCNRCKSKGRAKCYHWDVTDSVFVDVC